MKEVAEQELKVLEAQHPTRFQHLKLQLKEFIHLLDEQDQHYTSFKHHHSTITPQESSSSGWKKRQRENVVDDVYAIPKISSSSSRRKEGERVRDAVEKAEACLHKIKNLKSFLCSNSNDH